MTIVLRRLDRSRLMRSSAIHLAPFTWGVLVALLSSVAISPAHAQLVDSSPVVRAVTISSGIEIQFLQDGRVVQNFANTTPLTPTASLDLSGARVAVLQEDFGEGLGRLVPGLPGAQDPTAGVSTSGSSPPPAALPGPSTTPEEPAPQTRRRLSFGQRSRASGSRLPRFRFRRPEPVQQPTQPVDSAGAPENTSSAVLRLTTTSEGTNGVVTTPFTCVQNALPVLRIRARALGGAPGDEGLISYQINDEEFIPLGFIQNSEFSTFRFRLPVNVATVGPASQPNVPVVARTIRFRIAANTPSGGVIEVDRVSVEAARLPGFAPPFGGPSRLPPACAFQIDEARNLLGRS